MTINPCQEREFALVILTERTTNTDSIVNCNIGRLDNNVMGEEVYMRNIITIYQVFGSVTNPATGTKSLSLPGQISVCNGFLHRHLDNFILMWQIRTIYRDTPIWTTLLWHGNPAHLPGLFKNPLQVIGNLLYCRAVSKNASGSLNWPRAVPR